MRLLDLELKPPALLLYVPFAAGADDGVLAVLLLGERLAVVVLVRLGLGLGLLLLL